MVSGAAPTSSGRLMLAAGGSRVSVRSTEGEPAAAREQGDGVGQDQVADGGLVRAGVGGELVGELVEQVVVDPPGNDRHDRGVAFVSGA
jgi:hypothetical protein